MRSNHTKEKLRGAIGTIVFHALILLGFGFLSLTHTYTNKETINTIEFTVIEETPNPTQLNTPALSGSTVLTQNIEETTPVTTTQHPSFDLLTAMNKASNTKELTCKSEKKGIADDDSPINGIFQLSGRKLLQHPYVAYNTQEEGKVIVSIVVDREGKVIKAIGGAKGSTTTSEFLINIAEKSALDAQFNADMNAPDEQVGTLTFVFRLK